MATFRTRRLLLCVVGLTAVGLVSATWAKDELPKAVRSVLSDEGQLSRSDWNRRQRLGEELVKAKNSAEELRWHAGFVKLNGKWLPFEESISPEPISGNEREYLDRRERSEHTWASQTALATWCSQHGLGERGQAHNYHALMFAPKNADLAQHYQRMGYVRVGSEWLSRQEAFEAQRELVEYLEQLESGIPTVSRFADDLEAGRLSESSRRERLKQLANLNKIAALEQVLVPRSEQAGQAAVAALRQIPSYQASQALGRIAAHAPWLFVRDSAIDSLKDRRWEDFVPQWLSMFRMPITTEFQRVTWGRHQGILCLFRSERDFEIEVGQLLVWWSPNFSDRRSGGPRDSAQMSAYRRFAAQHIRRKGTDLVELASERATLVQNGRIDEINDRLIEGLRAVTGQKLGDSPKGWWDWWQDHSGLSAVPSNAKRVVIVKEEQQINLPPPPMRPPPPVSSCLVAGTLIRTERGLVAVERIRLGDRVLSKNIETGELDYKVVLHTTVREAFPVTKFVVGDETIQATEGHHFWVSGRGWTKTRELAAEQPLHTAIGAVRVASTEPAESAPTYNLVVADFHTYFVGKSGILSHDVLPPKPTNKVVPGLGE